MFVCNCGVNIAGVVDVNDVEAYAKTLPHVVYAGQNLFTCSQDSQEEMKAVIREKLHRELVLFKVENFVRRATEAAGMQVYADRISSK